MIALQARPSLKVEGEPINKAAVRAARPSMLKLSKSDDRLSALTPDQAFALAKKRELEPMSRPTPSWAIKRALWHENSQR